MAVLNLSLFGYPRVRLDGQPLSFARRSSLALLAYLAHTGAAHSRAQLAALLDDSPADGQATMRRSLADLKSHLGAHLFLSDRSVVLAPTLQVQTDAGVLEAAWRACWSNTLTGSLQAALDQCRGEFLEGLALPRALAFEEWQRFEGERLHTIKIQAYEQLYTLHWRAGLLDKALSGARQLLNLEPWHEGAHRAIMLLLLQSGRRAEALSHYAACCRTLDEELASAPGRETQAVYKQVLSSTPSPHNLPPEPTPLIGRTLELARLATWLDNPALRIIAITGTGGVGKTRLALCAAAGYVGAEPGITWLRFPDGVRLVALDAFSPDRHQPAAASARRIFGAIAAALRLPGDRDASDVLTMLCDRTLLLILDNAEHLSGVGRVLEQLVVGAPGVTILLTSRGPVPPAQQTLELAPMCVPGSAAELEKAEASALFLQRARQARLTFTPDVAEREAIVRICVAAGGLPLTLVLAAQQVRAASCHTIATQLVEHALDLEGALRNIPPRHRSQRANIAYSWELLSSAQQYAVRQTVADANERAVGASRLDRGEAIAALAAVGLLAGNGDTLPSLSPQLCAFLADQA